MFRNPYAKANWSRTTPSFSSVTSWKSLFLKNKSRECLIKINFYFKLQRSLRQNKILHRVLFEKAVLVLCHWSETVGRASLQILFWSCLRTCCLNSVSWRTPILNKSLKPKQMEPKLKFHCDRPPELASANLHISEATEGNLNCSGS